MWIGTVDYDEKIFKLPGYSGNQHGLIVLKMHPKSRGGCMCTVIHAGRGPVCVNAGINKKNHTPDGSAIINGRCGRAKSKCS